MTNRQIYISMVIGSGILFMIATAIPAPINLIGYTCAGSLFTIGAVIRSIEKNRRI